MNEFKFAVGQQVNGYTFGDRNNPYVPFKGGKVLEQYKNWLNGNCYVVQIGEHTYKLQEERING